MAPSTRSRTGARKGLHSTEQRRQDRVGATEVDQLSDPTRDQYKQILHYFPCVTPHNLWPRTDELVHSPPTRNETAPLTSHSPSDLQPALSMNPIQNTHMGAPLPLATSTRQPSPSISHIRSLPPSLCSFTRPLFPLSSSSQLADPAQGLRASNQQRMKQQPRNIARNGLKQSMNLHNDKLSRHAYNKFRVSVVLTARCLIALIDFLLLPGTCLCQNEGQKRGILG